MTTHRRPRPPEFWVMRVVLHKGRQPAQLSMMTPGAYLATMGLVATGDLVLIPGRDPLGRDTVIAEPLEVFSLEADAHEHRRKLLVDHPGADFRVVMNTDITV